MDEPDSKAKSHRQPRAGRKAEKKKKRTHPNDAGTEADARKRNPKAFALNSVVKAERQMRRKQDIIEKKTHVPIVDRTPAEPPPFVVALVGPPNSGKTSLLKCLVKSFTRQKMATIKGPVTVVSSKKRRITLMECPNDLNSMIDIAKVADLVLLLVDASYGFEMDTFEFLNICQVHGFPRVMGVLTHLDCIKNPKTLKRTKKVLKHRFWTEIYQGAKLFYLSKFVKDGYLRNEVKNLCRFISVMKFRPLQWRTTHPYLLVDRVEDITDEEQLRLAPHENRTVCLYGYGRGCFFKQNQDVHIPGVGDFSVDNISFLSDPCPIPEKREKRRRSLTEKEKLLYAPMSGVGGLVYDRDAVYIDMKADSKQSTAETNDENEPSDALVSDLLHSNVSIKDKMMNSHVKLFSITSATDTADDSGDDDEEEDTGDNEEDDEDEAEEVQSDEDDDDSISNENPDHDIDDVPDNNGIGGGIRRKVIFADMVADDPDEQPVFDDDDDEDITGKGLTWKTDLRAKASESFYNRMSRLDDIQSFVYGVAPSSELPDVIDDSDQIMDGLFTIKKKRIATDDSNSTSVDLDTESTKFVENKQHDWTNEEVMNSIRDAFVTGNWSEAEDAAALLSQSQKDEEVFGDFEDLETGEKRNASDETEITEDEKEEQRRAKKMQLKSAFDESYDDGAEKTFVDELKHEAEQQTKWNRDEFREMSDEVRSRFEGFRPGLYLRIQLSNVPCELIDHFDPDYPLIVGGLLSGETSVGYSQVRIKKHRWFKRILKTKDPLIISLGWRRFQTLPIFSMEDCSGRHRLLKYTQKHQHCQASFWGPIAPQGTGFIAIQSVSDESRDSRDFRIAATGLVLNLDKSVSIYKKLKLQGTPLKIHKKTAFIKGMFCSALEAVKYEGAAIRTVSAIRGLVKKAIRAPAGAFRATFEDKILMSDIVFMRTWIAIAVPKFYTLVRDLLMPVQDRLKWSGMKSVGLLRHENNIRIEHKRDSVYKDAKRKAFVFKPLSIPSKLQAQLPYKSKPKFMDKMNPETKRVAVIREPDEQREADAVKMLRAVHREKRRKEKDAASRRVLQHKKQLKQIEQRRTQKQQQVKKVVFRKKSEQKSAANRKAAKNQT